MAGGRKSGRGRGGGGAGGGGAGSLTTGVTGDAAPTCVSNFPPHFLLDLAWRREPSRQQEGKMLETQLEESASVQIFDGWICFAPFMAMVFDGLAACAVISCSVRVTGIPPLREAHRPQEEILSLRLTGENSGFSLWKSATSCQPAGFSRFSVDWMSRARVLLQNVGFRLRQERMRLLPMTAV